jgi:AmmeMemoRadiSam system protein B
MQFVDTAQRFDSRVTMHCESREADGRSPMELLMLVATHGSTVRLIIDGNDAEEAMEALASLIEDLDEDVGLVASSDMSHYLEDAQARALDRMAIDAAVKRSPISLYQVVHREGITMCGVVPATVAIEAANQLGASGAHLVAYATSGDVSGDRSAVVGYAGICIHR